MTAIMIDEGLREKLQGVQHEVALCDQNGRTIGHFLSEAEYTKLLYERARNLFTDEELDKAEQEPDGKPLAEILARLEGR
jgi:hypothetical protein